MSLAETLGSVISQISSDLQIKKVILKTWGGRDVPITTKNARQLLEAKCLQGILYGQGMMSDVLAPDLISSPIIAKEKNILSVISDEVPELATTGNYLNLMTLTVVWENDTTNTISGSVFGSIPHIGKFLPHHHHPHPPPLDLLTLTSLSPSRHHPLLTDQLESMKLMPILLSSHRLEAMS
jgi:hypothetical protein